LLTVGECHCEDEARKVVEKMVNQVHVVGEGYGNYFSMLDSTDLLRVFLVDISWCLQVYMLF
jgi:hypothetical protein